MRIILASSSPNRKALFEKLGIVFEAVKPSFEEIIDPNSPPEQQVKNFAYEKARSVFINHKEETNILIMGFDSMISFQGGSIGKPKTKKKAFNMIQSFVGRSQAIITGVCLMGNYNGKYFEETDMMSTPVQFRSDTTDHQIEKYLEFGDWQGKCGAYSILGTGVFFLEPVTGDFQNIIGVPVQKLGEMLFKVTGQSPFAIFEPKK